MSDGSRLVSSASCGHPVGERLSARLCGGAALKREVFCGEENGTDTDRKLLATSLHQSEMPARRSLICRTRVGARRGGARTASFPSIYHPER